MPNRIAWGAIGLACAALAGAAVAQPVRVMAIRHGYALPGDTSAAADPLPRAYPPERPQFYQDLDLPQASDYQDEVLRYSESGLTPVVVIQFAVVRPNRPVQVLVERASGLTHLKEATRAFGEISWDEFERLKALALPPILAVPAAVGGADGAGDEAVTAVDRVCTLEYAGLGIDARRRLPCAAEGAMLEAREAMLEAAARVAPSPVLPPRSR
jgi:hypothetical protein